LNFRPKGERVQFHLFDHRCKSIGALRSDKSFHPDLLHKILPAVGVDPTKLDQAARAVMRGLQRLCVTCNRKKRSQHRPAEGTAAVGFKEYSPTALTP